MVLTIVAAIFVFGMLVLVHELGHFATAKMTNMRVDEFAIGFGPKIFSVKKGETVYSLRAVPLGGFNKIAVSLRKKRKKKKHNDTYIKKPENKISNTVFFVFVFLLRNT